MQKRFLFLRLILPQAKFVFNGKLNIQIKISALAVALMIGWFIVRRLIRKLL